MSISYRSQNGWTSLAGIVLLLLSATNALACFKNLVGKSDQEKMNYLTTHKWLQGKSDIHTIKFKNGKVKKLTVSTNEENKGEGSNYIGLDDTGCYYRVEENVYEDYAADGGVTYYSINDGTPYFVRGQSFAQSKTGELVFAYASTEISAFFTIVKIGGKKPVEVARKTIKPQYQFNIIKPVWVSNTEIRLDNYKDVAPDDAKKSIFRK